MTNQASQLQEELEKAAPDIKWHAESLPHEIKIAWEKDVDGRRLSAELTIRWMPFDITAFAKALAGQVSRIQPTGRNSNEGIN